MWDRPRYLYSDHIVKWLRGPSLNNGIKQRLLCLKSFTVIVMTSGKAIVLSFLLEIDHDETPLGIYRKKTRS